MKSQFCDTLKPFELSCLFEIFRVLFRQKSYACWNYIKQNCQAICDIYMPVVSVLPQEAKVVLRLFCLWLNTIEVAT